MSKDTSECSIFGKKGNWFDNHEQDGGLRTFVNSFDHPVYSNNRKSENWSINSYSEGHSDNVSQNTNGRYSNNSFHSNKILHVNLYWNDQSLNRNDRNMSGSVTFNIGDVTSTYTDIVFFSLNISQL